MGLGAPRTAFVGEFQAASRAELSDRIMGGAERIGLSAGAWGIGAAVGSFGGPIGTGVGAAVGLGLDLTFGELYDRRSERGFQKFLRGAGSGINYGRGFSESEVRDISSSAFEMSGTFGDYNFKEFQDLVGLAAGGGVFDQTFTADQFKTKMKALRENMDTLTRTLKTEAEEVVKLMSDLSSTGVTDIGQQSAFLGAAGTMARQYGLSGGAVAQDMIATGASYTQAGFSPEAGMSNYLMTQNSLLGGLRSGDISNREIKMAGGRGNLNAAIQSSSMGFMRGPVGRSIAFGLSGGMGQGMSLGTMGRFRDGDISEAEIAMGVMANASGEGGLARFLEFEMSPDRHFGGMSNVDLIQGMASLSRNFARMHVPTFGDLDPTQQNKIVGSIMARRFGVEGTPAELLQMVKLGSRAGEESLVRSSGIKFGMMSGESVEDIEAAGGILTGTMRSRKGHGGRMVFASGFGALGAVDRAAMSSLALQDGRSLNDLTASLGAARDTVLDLFGMEGPEAEKAIFNFVSSGALSEIMGSDKVTAQSIMGIASNYGINIDENQGQMFRAVVLGQGKRTASGRNIKELQGSLNRGASAVTALFAGSGATAGMMSSIQGINRLETLMEGHGGRSYEENLRMLVEKIGEGTTGDTLRAEASSQQRVMIDQIRSVWEAMGKEGADKEALMKRAGAILSVGPNTGMSPEQVMFQTANQVKANDIAIKATAEVVKGMKE
jgi:hypothetical protein